MKKKHKKELKKALQQKLEVQNVFKQDKQGRSFFLGKELELKVQNYVKAVCLGECHMVFPITFATAEAPIESNPCHNLHMLDLRSSSWTQSVFLRLSYNKHWKGKSTKKISAGNCINILAQYSPKN